MRKENKARNQILDHWWQHARGQTRGVDAGSHLNLNFDGFSTRPWGKALVLFIQSTLGQTAALRSVIRGTPSARVGDSPAKKFPDLGIWLRGLLLMWRYWVGRKKTESTKREGVCATLPAATEYSQVGTGASIADYGSMRLSEVCSKLVMREFLENLSLVISSCNFPCLAAVADSWKGERINSAYPKNILLTLPFYI